MNFFVLGVNHKTAPVEVRERFAIPESRLPEALSKLTVDGGVEEGMIVSTCNRVEIFARSKNGQCDLQRFVREFFGFSAGEYEPYIFQHRELEAVKHVFRVASSLDSMVVGESQILGQVKEAYATARAVGAMNSQLDQLLTRAFAVAKKVRNETTIASSRRVDCIGGSGAGGEDLWQPDGQERVPGRRRQDVRAGGASPDRARRQEDLRGQPHL